MASSCSSNLQIVDLPSEMIAYIFQYLNYADLKIVSLACKLFYEISRSTRKFLSKAILTFTNTDDINLFMHDYKLQFYPNIHLYTINLKVVHNFFKKIGESIQELTLNHIDIDKNEFLMVLKEMPYLNSLNLYQCTVSSSIASEFCNKDDDMGNDVYKNSISKIKSLTIGSRCNQDDINFFSKILTFSIENRLKIISIDGRFPDISLLLSSNLKELHLQSKQQIFKSEIIENSLENLNILAIRNFHLLDFNNCLQRHTLDNLMCLDLSECSNINDNTLIQIANKCKNLNAISLNNCHYLLDSGFIALSQLKKLQIFHGTCCCSITSKAIVDGIASSRNNNMETLVLAKLNQISEDCIIRCVMNFPNLRILNLNNCKTGVTNKSLQLILQNLKMLQLLDIGYCNVTDEAFFNYSFLDVEEDNRKHRYYYSQNPDNLKVEHLLTNLKGLQVMNLHACNISNYMMLTQFKFMELRELNLNECNRMLETGLEAIGKYCPSIEKLSIIGCYKVDSTKCADIILQYFQRLKEICSCQCNSPKHTIETKNKNILEYLLITELYCEHCRSYYVR